MATIDLNAIRVASPCPADWSAMTGDERVRFCGQCQLSVYDLSELTSDEARALIEKHEGRLCVRFFRRRDGTVLTRDCPVGTRTVRRRRAGLAAGLAAAAGFAGGLVQGLRGRALPVLGTPRVVLEEPDAVMGAIPARLPVVTPPETVPTADPLDGPLQQEQGAMELQPEPRAEPEPELREVKGRVAADVGERH